MSEPHDSSAAIHGRPPARVDAPCELHLDWGGLGGFLLRSNCDLTASIGREAGGLLRPLPHAAPAMILTLACQPEVGVLPPDYCRFEHAIDPDRPEATFRLFGLHSEDELVLTAITAAALLIRCRLMNLRGEALHLHAAVVHKAGRTLLLAGESGAGKSTLTALLCNHGWRYLSDEDALLAGGIAHPLPRLLRMDAASADWLGLRSACTPFCGFFGERGWRWNGASAGYYADPAHVDAIVLLQRGDFPVVERSDPTPEEAAFRLLPLVQRERLGLAEEGEERARAAALRYNRQIPPALNRLLERVPVARLRYRLGGAPELLAQRFEELML